MSDLIEARSLALFDLVEEDATSERVAAGFTFTEGPVWYRDCLLFSDIANNRIVRWKALPRAGSLGIVFNRSGSNSAEARVASASPPTDGGADSSSSESSSTESSSRESSTGSDAPASVTAEKPAAASVPAKDARGPIKEPVAPAAAEPAPRNPDDGHRPPQPDRDGPPSSSNWG